MLRQFWMTLLAIMLPFGVALGIGGSNDPGGANSPHPSGQYDGPDGPGQTGPDG
jgi:hypothetical protein